MNAIQIVILIIYDFEKKLISIDHSSILTFHVFAHVSLWMYIHAFIFFTYWMLNCTGQNGK